MSTNPPNGSVGDDAGARAPSETTTRRARPIGWMIVAGVGIVAAVALGIWAVKLSSDLDSTQSELEEQAAAAQAAEAQVAAQADAATAVANELERVGADNEVYVVSNEEVARVESEVAAAEEAVATADANLSAAQDEASRLRAEVEQARAERDLARAERQQARICARGSLGALSTLGRSEDGSASSDLETVSSACAETVSG